MIAASIVSKVWSFCTNFASSHLRAIHALSGGVVSVTGEK